MSWGAGGLDLLPFLLWSRPLAQAVGVPYRYSSTTKRAPRLPLFARPYPHHPFPAHPAAPALGHVVDPHRDLAQLAVPGGPAARCNGLQSKQAETAIIAFSGPHYLPLSPWSGPNSVPLSLQLSAWACNPSSPDHIICH